MTARSGADSENDDEEEDGSLELEASVGFTDRGLGMKPPTVEYFYYFSDSQFCMHLRT